jgi:hypothetical protein
MPMGPLRDAKEAVESVKLLLWNLPERPFKPVFKRE